MTCFKTAGSGLLLAALVLMGCSQQSGPSPSAKSEDAAKENGEKESHAPHGAGPNGGVVFDLGKFHAEFTVDHPNNECRILVLGDDETTPTPVATNELTLSTKETKTQEGKTVPPMTIKMLPKDETDGKATTFVGTDPGLGNVADFDGTVLGVIDGKPSQGEFSESHGAATTRKAD